MSSSQPVLGRTAGGLAAPGRVRDRAREAAALMAFSACTSGCLAGALVILSHLGR